MLKTLLGLPLAFTIATAATAGSLSDPVVDQGVIAAQAASSSAPGAAWVLTLLTAAVVLAAAD